MAWQSKLISDEERSMMKMKKITNNDQSSEIFDGTPEMERILDDAIEKAIRENLNV